jgi:hypothetical protein
MKCNVNTRQLVMNVVGEETMIESRIGSDPLDGGGL